MNPKEPKTALPEARKATVADSHGLELGFCSSPPSYASCFLVRCNLHFGVGASQPQRTVFPSEEPASAKFMSPNSLQKPSG